MFYRYVIFLLAFVSQQSFVAKAAIDSFRIHTDFPTINKEEKMLLDVFYTSDSTFSGILQIQFFKFESEDDSILVLNKKNFRNTFKKGLNKIKLDFSQPDSNTNYNDRFYEILKRTNNIPPGRYKTYMTVKRGDKLYQTVYAHEADSSLGPNSPVRQDINRSLMPKSKSFLGMRFQKSVDTKVKSSGGAKALTNQRNKVDRAAKKRGLSTIHNEKDNKSYVDLYYKDWFAGRYEVKNNESLSKKINQQENIQNTPNFNSVNTNSDHPSLFSQYKKINNDKKNQDEVKGEIGLTTNLSTGQEQYSAVDNNYYELRGRVELPISNIPVELEGFYTSLDNHNTIKASYFRAHYDIDKMKDGLKESTNSYNKKFSETKSKSNGMQQIYQTSINNLEGQKTKLQNEINNETSGNTSTGSNLSSGKLKNDFTHDVQKQTKDTAGLKQSIANNSDSSDSDSQKTTDSSSDKKEKIKSQTADEKKRIEEKQKQIAELDKKIRKYNILLAQCENTNHFDSSIGYDKTKDISTQSNMSYKQMAKRSSSMLPDGQAKSFVTGITTMDIGRFPKDQSKYTMSGQMMKGLDFGYDLGFCETGVTLGKTEYVGRDGSLDKYTCYSAKGSFKPMRSQKITLLYYGYSPDHNMYAADNFFKNASISAPSFFQPVHIISTKYDGSISKFVTVGAEAATSIKKSDNADVPAYTMDDKMAYHFNVNGNIPKTPACLEGDYDKTGKGFENNTLPVTLNGTEQYKLGGKSDFFRSFLTIGIEFDRLVQSNFASRGISTKWGFDIKTNSKRYPNVALSYKPFTTFHLYTDTLSIPQRPLLGSIWTGKASYQIKRHGRSIRFLILYNKSTSTMDTSKYGNDLEQFSIIYTDKQLMTSFSFGYMQLTGANFIATPATTPNNTAFLSINSSYMLSRKLSLIGGQDFGIAAFGFCRYSINGGFMLRPEKTPITIRVNMRFNTYELNKGESWKQLYSGNVDLAYRFKAKTTDKNNFR